MSKFIEVHENGDEMMINLDWVEEIRKSDWGKADIYYSFQLNGCLGQDSVITDETYDEVKQKIMEAING